MQMTETRLFVVILLVLVAGSLHYHMAVNDPHEAVILVHSEGVPVHGDIPNKNVPHPDDPFFRSSGGEMSCSGSASPFRHVITSIGKPSHVTGTVWEPPKSA